MGLQLFITIKPLYFLCVIRITSFLSRKTARAFPSNYRHDGKARVGFRLFISPSDVLALCYSMFTVADVIRNHLFYRE